MEYEAMTINVVYSSLDKSLGVGDTPLYELYRYVLPQRIWVLSRFGLRKQI